jgi:hypothetical protein
LSESDSTPPSPTYMDPSQDMETTMQRRLRQERLSPPFFYPEEQRRRNRKESTVSLLTSALALSSLHDSNNDQPSQDYNV